MKNFSLLNRSSLIAALVLGGPLLGVHGQIPWATEAFSRQEKIEFYGVGQYLHQGDTTFSNPFGNSTRLTLDDTGLGGLGVAYHFNDFLAIHGDFMLGPASFRAQGNPIGEDGFLQTGRFNVDYNIINRRLTPFLTAGIGYQYLQLDQEGAYYNSYYYETDFTWNVGAGVRWNITDNFFIKLTGGAQWLQYEGADNVTTQVEAMLAIGGTFP